MKPRALVVDDNGANLSLIVYLLEAFGYDVQSATDGIAGLEAARSSAFELILCDVLMPGLDGFEFARRYRAEHPDGAATLIAVTALAMVGDRERILAAGFDGYIAKPIEPENFKEQLETLLSDSPSGHAAPRGPAILVVDDVPVNIEVVRGALEPFGFVVRAATDAIEAMESIEREPPDLILCDLHMPHGDGFSLIVRVKEREALARIPFLFISSTTWHSGDKTRALELGARKLLHRPIEPRELLVEIKTALANA